MRNLYSPWSSPPLALAALLLASSLLPRVAGAVDLYFGRIQGDLTLDPGSLTPAAAFLVPSEGIVSGVGLLADGSVNIRGSSPVMGETYPPACGSASFLTYPFGNTAPLQPTGSVAPHTSAYRTADFLLIPATGNPAAPGVVDDQSIPYWVDLRLDLQDGNKHYYAEAFRSDALLPFDPTTQLPADSRHLEERVGTLRVRLYCGDPANGSIQVLTVQSAFITATLQPFIPSVPPCLPLRSPKNGEPGTVQASVNLPTPSPLDSTFLVRADRSYVVTVEFTVGDAAGLVQGAYSSPPTAVVSQGENVDVDIVVDPVFCDFGAGCHSAIGRLELIGANIFQPCLLPSVGIFFGPFGNVRYADINPVGGYPGYPSANYKLEDVIPSLAVFPQTWPYKDYTPVAQFDFQTTGGFFEHMLIYAAERPYGCVGYGDLEDFFVMDPGFLKGDIYLAGPPTCVTSPSCIELITSDPLTACTAQNFGNNTSVSFVGADNNGGSSRLAFSAITGTPTSPTVWEGKYELFLAGTKPEPFSSWNTGGLLLRMGTANGPSYLGITDGLASGSGVPYAPLKVYPQMTYRNDLAYCLSEITLTLVNQSSLKIAGPMVTAIGNYGTATTTLPDPLNPLQQASYTAGGNFYGTPTIYMPGNASIRLCLPQGDYTLTPSVSYYDPINGTTGNSPFPPFLMKVGCKQCISVVVTPEGPGPTIILDGLTACTSQAAYALQGTAEAAPGHFLTAVSYTLNGGAPVTLCSANCGAALNLSGSSIPLAPCDNTVTVEATDDQGLSGSATFSVRYDNTPPVITGCVNKIVPAEAGQSGTVVSFAVSAMDNCDGAIQPVYNPPSGSFFPVGDTQVTSTATDTCGNSSICSFTVSVSNVDGTPPVIHCPGDIVTVTDPGLCSTVVTFNSMASDDRPGVTFSCFPPSGSSFAKGTTTVVCTATDAVGNIASCSFTVTVVDNQPPKARCQDVLVNLTTSGGMATLTPQDVDGGSSDNCGIVEWTLDRTMFGRCDLGTHSVTLTVKDAAGLTDSCVTTVIVTLDTVTVSQNSTINFNLNPPAFVGDPSLLPFLSYDKSGGTTPDKWKAIIDVGPRKLLIKTGAIITTTTVPATSNNRKAPGIVINTCEVEIEEGGGVVVTSVNQPAGDIFIQATGQTLINGFVRNEVLGTLGRPGAISIASCCREMVTGPESRIETLGVDPGGNNISLVTCQTGGDIFLSGLVRAMHKMGITPMINISSFAGTVTIDGNNDFGQETISGGVVRTTSGVQVRTLNATSAGNIRIQAHGDITVWGNRILDRNTTQCGAVAIRSDNTNGKGGSGLMDVRSVAGSIYGTDRAFDFENRFNGLNQIQLMAAGHIALGVTLLKNDGAADNTKTVVNAQGGDTGKGGINILGAYTGGIDVGAKAQVLAGFTGRSGANGSNLFGSCTGNLILGLVSPAPGVSTLCSSPSPSPLFNSCAEFGLNCP